MLSRLNDECFYVSSGSDVVIVNLINRRWVLTTDLGLSVYKEYLANISLKDSNEKMEFVQDIERVLKEPITPIKKERGCAVYLTNACNMRCIHCRFSCFKSSSLLQLDDIKRYIGSEHKRGATRVTFTGGEPMLMRSLLVESIYFAKSLGLDTFVLTNGSLIDKDIAEIFHDTETGVQVSLDTLEPEKFMLFRGVPLNRVLRGIFMLLDRRVKVSLSSTLNAFTIGDMDKVVDFAKDNKVFGLHFSLLEKGGRAIDSWNSLELSDDELINFYGALLNKYFNEGLREELSLQDIELMMSQIANPPAASHCNLACAVSALFEDKSIYGCTNVCGDPNFLIGKVGNETEDLVAVESLLHGRLPKATQIMECASCEFGWVCLGGCRDRVMRSNNGRLDRPDPYCKVLKWLFSRLLMETARIVERGGESG